MIDKTTVHFFDHEKSELQLETGVSIPVNIKKFSSLQSAVERLAEWAKDKKLIGKNDCVATYIY